MLQEPDIIEEKYQKKYLSRQQLRINHYRFFFESANAELTEAGCTSKKSAWTALSPMLNA
jgi:hypothetical protein